MLQNFDHSREDLKEKWDGKFKSLNGDSVRRRKYGWKKLRTLNIYVIFVDTRAFAYLRNNKLLF